MSIGFEGKLSQSGGDSTTAIDNQNIQQLPSAQKSQNKISYLVKKSHKLIKQDLEILLRSVNEALMSDQDYNSKLEAVLEKHPHSVLQQNIRLNVQEFVTFFDGYRSKHRVPKQQEGMNMISKEELCIKLRHTLSSLPTDDPLYIPSTKQEYDVLSPQQQAQATYALTQQITHSRLQDNGLGSYSESYLGLGISQFIIDSYPRVGLSLKMFTGKGSLQIKLRNVLSSLPTDDPLSIPSTKQEYDKLSSTQQEQAIYTLTQQITHLTHSRLQDNGLGSYSTYYRGLGGIPQFIIDSYPRVGLSLKMFTGKGSLQIKLRNVLSSLPTDDPFSIPSTKKEYDKLSSKQKEYIQYTLTQQITHSRLQDRGLGSYNPYCRGLGGIPPFIIDSYPRVGLSLEMFTGKGSLQIKLRHTLSSLPTD
ncbi:MAG TPA: hypothetical protein PLW93_00420, partial [Candidatus Absconditabacterales bacterium]|nr:hypothetical protein [Candidatus Absconditabacterales bacterium]